MSFSAEPVNRLLVILDAIKILIHILGNHDDFRRLHDGDLQ